MSKHFSLAVASAAALIASTAESARASDEHVDPRSQEPCTTQWDYERISCSVPKLTRKGHLNQPVLYGPQGGYRTRRGGSR